MACLLVTASQLIAKKPRGRAAPQSQRIQNLLGSLPAQVRGSSTFETSNTNITTAIATHHYPYSPWTLSPHLLSSAQLAAVRLRRWRYHSKRGIPVLHVSNNLPFTLPCAAFLPFGVSLLRSANSCQCYCVYSLVVRTPTKLSSLLSARSAPQESLTLIQGDVKDPAAVAKTLTGASIIVTGVGGAPKFTPNPFRPTLDDPVICQTAAGTIISCLQEIQKSEGERYRAPLLAAISAPGLDSRDTPWVLMPLYKLMLPIPHRDKAAMEDVIVGAAQGLLEYVIVRPAMFTNKAAVGEKGVKAGYEGRVKKGDGRWGDVKGIVAGYTMSREDVGEFLFEEVIKREGGEWKGKKVSLVS